MRRHANVDFYHGEVLEITVPASHWIIPPRIKHNGDSGRRGNLERLTSKKRQFDRPLGGQVGLPLKFHHAVVVGHSTPSVESRIDISHVTLQTLMRQLATNWTKRQDFPLIKHNQLKEGCYG